MESQSEGKGETEEGQVFKVTSFCYISKEVVKNETCSKFPYS